MKRHSSFRVSDWDKPIMIFSPQSGTFESELRSRYGTEAKIYALEILEALRIPVPRNGEFLAGKESVLLFLHRVGLALRFGERCKAPVSDKILQPLIRYDLAPAADFEVLPGVRVGGSALDKICLHFSLRAGRIVFPRGEMVTSNMGSLNPLQVRHRIVIDRGACSGTGLSAEFASAANADIQSRYYALFYAAARDAFGTDLADLKPGKVKEFFDFCEADTARANTDADKHLFNEWSVLNTERVKSAYARQTALAFAQKF